MGYGGFVIGGAVFVELYVMRDLKQHETKAENIEDLSSRQQIFLAGVVAILFLSFFNPLWFIF